MLARAGQGAGLLPDAEFQAFLGASILSMLATPFLIMLAPRAGFAMQRLLSDGPARDVENTEEDIHLTSSGGLEQHVIIVGYGLNGRNLARVLRAVGVPYTILDADPHVVRTAKRKGEKINFGDATRREVLVHARVESAWVMVLAMSDPAAARRGVATARRLNEKLHIIVRTRYTAEITELYNLGANEVIPEEFETSIEIFARVLHRFGVPRSTIEDQISRIRKQGYEMLRSSSLPQLEMGTLQAALHDAATETVRLSAGSPAVGTSLGQLDLRGKTGTTVVAVIRDGETHVSPGAGYELREGDTLLLTGSAEKIERAVNTLESDGEIGGFNP